MSSPTPTDEQSRRSVSRGRDAFQKSTGRGGAGNIAVSPSTGPRSDPESFSPVRGREVDSTHEKIKSVGRGGVGNIRSRSRSRAAAQIPEGFPQTQSLVSDYQANTAAYERQVIEDATKAKIVHSSGRGGAGNISNSRSRSRGPGKFFGGVVPPDSPRHSTGRGGVGNIQQGADGVESIDETEAYRVTHDPEGIPAPEAHGHLQLDFESSGRGGAGNIRSRSTSRDGPRSVSRDKLSKMWQKVTHHQGNPNTPSHDIMEEQEHANGVPAKKSKGARSKVEYEEISLMEMPPRPHASLSVYTDSVSQHSVLSSSASSCRSTQSSYSQTSSSSIYNSNDQQQQQQSSPPLPTPPLSPTSPPSPDYSDLPDFPYFPSTAMSTSSPSSPSTWATNMAHRQSSYAIAAYDLSSMPSIKTHSQMLWHQRQSRQSNKRRWFHANANASQSLQTLAEDEEYVSFLDLT
ncbi:hypothetical protein BDY19DRAFT_993611 [Irpex rosettiformis]|uniref:Uncharacterized protein n=1 Tax=Irpex rosettiformis TaxID=378272 RepID=A0ACB8U3H1_9APHY|nr:hypothetical protein BDY19DRAFT_993611 [Irpex rosettiformis]